MSFDLKDYKIKEQIGKGVYGKIFLVEDKKGEQFALKEIDMKPLYQVEKQNMIFESSMCTVLKHKNIVKCFGSIIEDNTIYLLFEYANGGNLNINTLTGNEIKNMIKDILSALEYCHNMRICHSDLHSGNILVFIDKNEKKHFKIADWGMSQENKDIEFPCDKTDIWSVGQIILNSLDYSMINDPKAVNFAEKLIERRYSAKEALQDEWLREVEK